MDMITKAQVNPMCTGLNELPSFQLVINGRVIDFKPNDYAKKVRSPLFVMKIFIYLLFPSQVDSDGQQQCIPAFAAQARSAIYVDFSLLFNSFLSLTETFSR